MVPAGTSRVPNSHIVMAYVLIVMAYVLMAYVVMPPPHFRVPNSLSHSRSGVSAGVREAVHTVTLSPHAR